MPRVGVSITPVQVSYRCRCSTRIPIHRPRCEDYFQSSRSSRSKIAARARARANASTESSPATAARRRQLPERRAASSPDTFPGTESSDHTCVAATVANFEYSNATFPPSECPITTEGAPSARAKSSTSLARLAPSPSRPRPRRPDLRAPSVSAKIHENDAPLLRSQTLSKPLRKRAPVPSRAEKTVEKERRASVPSILPVRLVR